MTISGEFNHGKRILAVAIILLGMFYGQGMAWAQLGENLIPNPSFEESAGALPQGWSITRVSQADPPAVEYANGLEDEAAAAHTGDRFLRFHVSDAPNGPTTILDHNTLIPVVSGATYRVQMFYRFDRLDDFGDGAHLGRMTLRLIYYYNAQRDPAGPPDPRPLGYQDLPYGQVTTGLYPTLAVWRSVQREIFPGETEDGRRAEWVKLRLEPNNNFQGVVAIDDLSLTQLVNARVHPPESGLAFDFVASQCNAASTRAGRSCASDQDCPGAEGQPDGRCVPNASTPGFTAVPAHLEFPAGECDCGFVRDNGQVPTTLDASGYPTRFFANAASRGRFRVNLPSGDYHITLYMGGHWRNSPREENHSIEVNGRLEVDENVEQNAL